MPLIIINIIVIKSDRDLIIQFRLQISKSDLKELKKNCSTSNNYTYNRNFSIA